MVIWLVRMIELGFRPFQKRMSFWCFICNPNRPLYLGQTFNMLDKLVIKLKKWKQNQYIFLMLKTQNDFFVLLFFFLMLIMVFLC
jgi:hypothetical protein